MTANHDYSDLSLLSYNNNKYRYLSESPSNKSPESKSAKKKLVLKHSGVLLPGQI